MRHPLLQAFGVAARSLECWTIIGLTVEEAKQCAFSMVELGDADQKDAYLAAWGF